MSQYIILKLFGKKMLEFFFSKAKGKGANLYKGFKKKQYQKQYIKSIDVEFLRRYGEKSFYDKLSKLVVSDDVLNKIYNYCYLIEINKYQTNEQFLKELTSGKEYQYFEGKQIEGILKHIFNATFSILNKPEFDDTRKIINIICAFRNESLNNQNQILSKQEEILNEIRSLKISTSGQGVKDTPITYQEQKELTIFSNPILQFYKENYEYCNILLSSNNSEPLFKITLIVKGIGDIKKFTSINQYFSYLMFVGKDDILDVVGIKIESIIDGSIYVDIEKEYYGPTFKLIPFNTYTVGSLPSSGDIKNMDMKIKIVPPKTILNISIQNEENEILFDSKIYNISRNKLENGDLEVTWNDVSENQDITVTIKSIFRNAKSIEDTKIISSTISISNSSKDTVIGRLNYYRVFKKLISAKKIIYRDKETGLYIGEGKGFKSGISIDIINKQIEIYKQLITIQDSFNTRFIMPDKFDFELIDTIRQIYELISYGKTTMSEYDFTFKKSELYLQNKLEIDSVIMITADIKTIQLLGKTLNFGNTTIIVPKAKLSEITNESYKFESVDLSYIVLNDKYGGLNGIELAKSLLSEVT